MNEKRKIKLDGINAEVMFYETKDGWRCEVVWMQTWGRGASILGRGTHAEGAFSDFRRRAEDDGQKIEML